MIHRKQQVVMRRKRKQRRRRAVLRTVSWIFIGSFTAGLLYILFSFSRVILFSSEYFQIRVIETIGMSVEESDKMLKSLNIQKGDNIFSFSAKKITRAVKTAHPEMKEIEIRRDLPARVTVDITYRNPIATMAFGDRMLCIDDEGIIFRLPVLDSKEYLKKMFLPEIHAQGDAERKELVRFLTLLNACDPEQSKKIVRLQTEIPLDIVYILSDGTRISWGDLNEKNFKEKYKRMQIVYNDSVKRFSRIRSVNMRYWEDGRVLVRPRGSSSEDESY